MRLCKVEMTNFTSVIRAIIRAIKVQDGARGLPDISAAD